MQATKGDIGAKIELRDGQSKKCPNCAAIDHWQPGGCQQCGTLSLPIYVCECGGTFDEDCDVEYTATSGITNITEVYPADRCRQCGKVLLLGVFTEELEEFVVSVPQNFQIIREVGISTPDFLEILIDSHDDSGIETEILRRSQGISAKVGASSKLFKRSLNHITAYDIDDYGHSYSPTLKIRPGPPYSLEQRKIIHVLLGRIRKANKAPLRFWSVHFEADSEEHEEIIAELIDHLDAWSLDPGKEAIALANAISNNNEPGIFVNSFRLLELVLERLLDKDIVKNRRSSAVSSEAFISLVRTHNTDLKTKIRRRAEALSVYPENDLKALWRITCPSRGFNPNEAYERVASFRNMHVHQPLRNNEPLILPWEIPNYNLFARLLLSLIIKFIKG